jgi:uncharacterized membrane protein
MRFWTILAFSYFASSHHHRSAMSPPTQIAPESPPPSASTPEIFARSPFHPDQVLAKAYAFWPTINTSLRALLIFVAWFLFASIIKFEWAARVVDNVGQLVQMWQFHHRYPTRPIIKNPHIYFLIAFVILLALEVSPSANQCNAQEHRGTEPACIFAGLLVLAWMAMAVRSFVLLWQGVVKEALAAILQAVTVAVDPLIRERNSPAACPDSD